MPPITRAKRWCFTLNNYVQGDIDRLNATGPLVTYLVFGREVGAAGTPHLQGFVIFNDRVSLTVAKQQIGDRAHLEVARGTSVQAATYCKKDGDFTEFGNLPEGQGRRSDWDRYRDWIEQLGRMPSRRELIREFPGLYGRYSKRCLEIADAFLPAPSLTDSVPRFGWQTEADGLMRGNPHSRHIHFVVDPVGNSGKSWFCSYMLTQFPDEVQILRIGKRDDLAYNIDAVKRIFLFDIPRGQMIYLQYNILESLKDRMVFSPKYESSLKVLTSVPHVMVLCNEAPDMDALSADRYNIINV